MSIIVLLVGLFNGLFQSTMSFYQPIKDSNWYYTLGLPVSLIFMGVWFFIARATPIKEDVYRLGAIWDSAIILSWYLGSIWMFGLKFSMLTWVGIALVIIGASVIKISELT